MDHIAHFQCPADVAIVDDDSIIVSDSSNDCIHVLNPNGSTKHTFGSSGSGEGQLNRPRGVATDGENILVADSGNNRISSLSVWWNICVDDYKWRWSFAGSMELSCH